MGVGLLAWVLALARARTSGSGALVGAGSGRYIKLQGSLAIHNYIYIYIDLFTLKWYLIPSPIS